MGMGGGTGCGFLYESTGIIIDEKQEGEEGYKPGHYDLWIDVNDREAGPAHYALKDNDLVALAAAKAGELEGKLAHINPTSTKKLVGNRFTGWIELSKALRGAVLEKERRASEKKH